MGTDFRKPLLLESHPFEHRQFRQQRMRPAGLRESPYQHGISGFEEQQFYGVTEFFDSLKDAGEVGEKHPFSDVDAERDVFDFTTLLVTEFDEGWKEGWR